MMLMLVAFTVACTGAFAHVPPEASLCKTMMPLNPEVALATRVKCCNTKFVKSILDASCELFTTSCMYSNSVRTECCQKKLSFDIKDAWCENIITFVNECGKNVTLTISGMFARTKKPFFSCGRHQHNIAAGEEYRYVMLNDAPYFSSPDVQVATIVESGSYVYGMHYKKLKKKVANVRMDDAHIKKHGAYNGAMYQCEKFADVIFFDASHAPDMSSRTIVLCGMK